MTLFFFHIPKTGGTSLKRVIESWASMVRDVDLGPTRAAMIEQDRSHDICVTGHFDARLYGTSAALVNRFPWIVGCAEAFVFTLLRDPLEQAVSTYYHERAAGRTHVALRDFIERRHEYAYRKVLELRSLRDIEPALSSFAYVGVTEHLQLAADQLADRLDKPRKKVPVSNVRERDSQAATLSAADRRFLETLYSFECELYARARDAVMGGQAIEWIAASQFVAREQEDSLRACALVSGVDDASAARLLSFCAQDGDGAPRAEFDCREPVRFRIEFEVFDACAPIEPVFAVWRSGHPVFSVAYVPDDGEPPRFEHGKHALTVAIPGNLLNPGRFEVVASLCTPWPVSKHDETILPVVISITESEEAIGSARGQWVTPFPGGVRPLLKWRSAD